MPDLQSETRPGGVALNYWERHIGDWLRDTTGLTMIEDGAYTRLCDVYYTREKPLPADTAECCRIARAFSAAERKAVKGVLEQFFQRQTDGWHHKRIDEEVAKVQAKSQKARASANSRWHMNGNAVAYANGHAVVPETHMQTACESDALQSPDSSPQSPVTNSTPLPPSGGGGDVRKTRSDRKAEAELAWKRLVNSQGELGREDPRVQAAITAAGGWSRISMRQSGADAARLQGVFIAGFLGAPA